MRMLKSMLMAILLAWLAVACSATQEDPLSLDEKLAAKGYVMGEQVKRVRDWNLNGWSYVDDRHFIMQSGVRDRFLVSLRVPSYDLRSAISIAFTTTVGSLSDTDRNMGERKVEEPDGRGSTIYSTGTADKRQDPGEESEWEKRERAWEMLDNVIIDARDGKNKGDRDRRKKE